MIPLNPLNADDHDYMVELVDRSHDDNYVKVVCSDCDGKGITDEDEESALICETCMGQGFLFEKKWKQLKI
jgi:DnaJ-class molecular chaperone